MTSSEVSYDSRPETYEHILQVQTQLWLVIERLGHRMLIHDASKLVPPEVAVFNEYTPKLRNMEYGSDEYKASLEGMSGALEHHYSRNPHHPEYHSNGIRGMSLLDLIEMLCDWYAASQRMRPSAPSTRGDVPAYSSDFQRSIELNRYRFGYGSDLADIFTNTARELGMIDLKKE